MMRTKSASVLWDIIGRLANTTLTIRISGEAGVGKEAVARLLYVYYPHENGSFLKIDCRQLKPAPAPSPMADLNALLNSPQRRLLYLENTDHASPEVQNQLLELLSIDYSSCPPWILTSSLQPLEQAVHDGRFSLPLFRALDTVHISLPTLRSRSEKIPQILSWLLSHDNRKGQSGFLSMPNMAEMERMLNYHWPRNWRQLQEVVNKALANADWGIALSDLNSHDGEAETIDSIAAIFILSKAKLGIHKEKVMEAMVTATELNELGLLDLAIFNEAVSQMVHHIDLVNQDNEESHS